MHSDGWSCIQAGHFDSRFIWVMYIFTIFSTCSISHWVYCFQRSAYHFSSEFHPVWLTGLWHSAIRCKLSSDRCIPLMNWLFLSVWSVYVFPDRIPCPEILLAITDFFWWIFAYVLTSIFLFLVLCLNYMGWAFSFSLLIPIPSPSQAFNRWVNLNSEAQDRN